MSTQVQVELGNGHAPLIEAARAGLTHLLADPDMDIHVGYGDPPPGFRVVESWRVFPHRRAPRFLLPVDTGAARRALTSHRGLREPATAAIRTMAAANLGWWDRLGPGRGDVLNLSVPARSSEAEVAATVITRHLCCQVNHAELTAISLREFHPRAKPTVQLLDASGAVVGFAKVSSDPATSSRVTAESRLLRHLGDELASTAADVIALPAMLSLGSVGNFTYSITAPLPEYARRAQARDQLRVLRPLMHLAGAFGLEQQPLHTTTLWHDISARMPMVSATRAQHGLLVAALDQLWLSMQATDADQVLTQGAYHGDWVPWNMAWADEVLWVWDLEYGSLRAPVGLDALRWVFQQHHVAKRTTVAEAVAAMAAQAAELLPMMGVNDQVAPTLIRLHLAETLSTALELAASGRGLPPHLDGIAAVAEHWTLV